mmetsp:Transcript_1323/g.2597  ORF Transcript_1323/g.2597 Transcript_1323/m.2597 type:complete len:292 (-) Transcript_1323:526-1401(-)
MNMSKSFAKLSLCDLPALLTAEAPCATSAGGAARPIRSSMSDPPIRSAAGDAFEVERCESKPLSRSTCELGAAGFAVLAKKSSCTAVLAKPLLCGGACEAAAGGPPRMPNGSWCSGGGGADGGVYEPKSEGGGGGGGACCCACACACACCCCCACPCCCCGGDCDDLLAPCALPCDVLALACDVRAATFCTASAATSSRAALHRSLSSEALAAAITCAMASEAPVQYSSCEQTTPMKAAHSVSCRAAFTTATSRMTPCECLWKVMRACSRLASYSRLLAGSVVRRPICFRR